MPHRTDHKLAPAPVLIYTLGVLSVFNKKLNLCNNNHKTIIIQNLNNVSGLDRMGDPQKRKPACRQAGLCISDLEMGCLPPFEINQVKPPSFTERSEAGSRDRAKNSAEFLCGL